MKIVSLIFLDHSLGRLELEHPEFERTGEPYYKASVTNETIIPSATQARYDTTDSNASLDRTATADSGTLNEHLVQNM